MPVLAVLALLAGVGGLGLLGEHQTQQAFIELSTPVRAAIFARAREDLAETCGLPDAMDGPLREHCIEQATFVSRFPECDDGCERAARAHLPSPRR